MRKGQLYYVTKLFRLGNNHTHYKSFISSANSIFLVGLFVSVTLISLFLQKMIFAGKSAQVVSTKSAFEDLPYDQQRHEILAMSQKDPKQAWDFLKEHGDIAKNAHIFSHLIGDKIYEKFGFSGITICDDTFNDGCYHGVTERMLLTLGGQSIKKIESDCTRLWSPDASTDYIGCIHGAGHGLILWRSLNLNRALSDCDSFSANYRDPCYDGVFMEYSQSAPKKMFNKNDIWEQCRNLAREYQAKCAKYIPKIVKYRFGASPSDAAAVCKQAPNKELKTNCLSSLPNIKE